MVKKRGIKPQKLKEDNWKSCFKISKRKILYVIFISAVYYLAMAIYLGSMFQGPEPNVLIQGIFFVGYPIIILSFSFVLYSLLNYSLALMIIALIILILLYFYLLVSIVQLILFGIKKWRTK